MARPRRRAGRRRAARRRRGDRLRRGGRLLPRPRQRGRAVRRARRRRRRAARGHRRRAARGAADRHAPADARGDARGPARAMDARRAAAVGIALVSFYATYLAYRNLKAIVPLPAARRPVRPPAGRRRPRHVPRPRPRGPAARPARDRRRGAPAVDLLRRVHRLPAALAGLALVFSHRLQLSLFYAAALSINWVLGAATYFLLPALGPIYAFPQWFARAAAHGGDPAAADAARRADRASSRTRRTGRRRRSRRSRRCTSR